jgi:hypothetical protein
MKKKQIMAIGALGFGAGIGLSCMAQINVPQPPTAPAPPTTSVWDGSEYVGQVDGKYYYLDTNAQPSPTWLALDQTRQQRFEAYTNSAGYNPSAQPSQTGNTNEQSGQIYGPSAQVSGMGQNPSEQTNQIGNTRSHGPAMGPNASEQSGQIQNTGSNPNATNQIRNTRYQGHDMGQTRPIAPPHPQ